MPRGGKRAGAGRPAGSGRFSEPGRSVWIPDSLWLSVAEMIAQHSSKAAQQRADRIAVDPAPVTMPEAGQVRLDGPIGALEQLARLRAAKVRAAVVILDPHYRRVAPKGRAEYLAELLPLVSLAGDIADHVIVWGFPLTVARLVDHQPPNLMVEGWISWIYRNSANRARSWRGAQQAALHLRRPGAKLHYEAFLSEEHRAMHAKGKLAYLMTHRDIIIEEPLLSGFIRRSEQTGFSGGQKPVSVMTPLLQMTTQPGDLVIDPTAGSGTTGEAAARLGCSAILSDGAPASLRIARLRLAAFLVDA